MITRRLALAGVAALALTGTTFAADKATVLASVPGMSFPFFVHMMGAFKKEAEKLGYNVIESDGQVSSPKQTADIEAALAKGVKGIVLSPNEVDAMAPALQEAVDAGVPVVTVDRRVPKVTGILAHIGADNVKGGEAQGNLVLKLFPTVGPVTVARAVMSAVARKRRSVVVGPVAGVVLGSAAIMPRGLDLAFMTLLFKGKRVAA